VDACGSIMPCSSDTRTHRTGTPSHSAIRPARPGKTHGGVDRPGRPSDGSTAGRFTSGLEKFGQLVGRALHLQENQAELGAAEG
jgi:hypothetical protein